MLNVFATNRCTFSCSYCSRNVHDDATGVENRYDDTSEFHCKDLQLLLNKYPSIKYVSFVGIGEPFLIADLLPMAQLSKSQDKHVSVITNGSLLHRYRGQTGSLFDSISISLHGLTADELVAVAKVKPEMFDQLVENIHYLISEEAPMNPGMEIRASVVALKDNMERVRRAAQFCTKHSIPILDIQNYLPYGLDDVEKCLFDDDLIHLNSIHQMVEEFNGIVKINPPLLIKRTEREMVWGCTSFFTTLRVDGLGQVSGCGRMMVPKAENGNIHDREDVWNNLYFTVMRRNFRKRNHLPACCRYCPDAQ